MMHVEHDGEQVYLVVGEITLELSPALAVGLANALQVAGQESWVGAVAVPAVRVKARERMSE